MKKFILLFLPIIVFSQTPKDREKIISSYDFNKIALLKIKTDNFLKEQKILIDNFKLKNPSIDFSTNSLQRIFDGQPIYFQADNLEAGITINANSMYSGGALNLNVSGQNMTAGVWDGGKVRNTHQELVGKITFGDQSSTPDMHATHVTGTIIASGVSPTRKGIAYNASAITYDWNSDISEMLGFGSDGYLASNHSYGYQAESLSNSNFGKYDNTSATMDEIMYSFPYYQVVIAAGNDRNNANLSQVNIKNGYDLLTGMSTSKNGITVAAVFNVSNYIDNYSVNASTFTNYGPTDDGRIKPDIASKGVSVSSCNISSNVTYSTLDGTSMASPGITGLILLLQKHYNNINGSYMKASTVRGLICHSAREAGENNGPDYELGWGLANAGKAASIIQNNNLSTIVEEGNLVNNQIFTKQFTVTNQQDIEVTIAWTDPEGNTNNGIIDDSAPRLVNNLDLKIIKGSNVYYPWKLNGATPLAAATNNSDNNVDNIEKVHIYNAQPGVYTIQVKHKGSLQSGSQNFSLIANGSTALVLNTNEYEIDKSISLYPNPTSNVLNFDASDFTEISQVQIIDLSGKIINTNFNLNQKSIDVSNLQTGVYFIKFTTNNEIITKKFIKK